MGGFRKGTGDKVLFGKVKNWVEIRGYNYDFDLCTCGEYMICKHRVIKLVG